MANEKRLIDVDAFLADHCGECRYASNGTCSKDEPMCGTIWDLVEYPTVDAVEVVHGRWQNWHYDPCEDCYVHTCSKCGGTNERMKPYCPNCGAKMDGEKERGRMNKPYIYYKEQCDYCMNKCKCDYEKRTRKFVETISGVENLSSGVFGSLSFKCDYFNLDQLAYDTRHPAESEG